MRKGIRETKQDRIFNGINRVFMILIFIIFAWPLWFVVAASFSDPNAVTQRASMVLARIFSYGRLCHDI